MVIEPIARKLSEKERETQKEFVLDNGNKVHIRQDGPHGFWYMHLDKGQLPDELRAPACWTNYQMAEQAALNYISDKRRTVHTAVI